MAFRSLRTAAAALAVAAAGMAFHTAPAGAQVMYGGYDLGPNYGAMIEQQLERGRQMQGQMAQREQQIIAQVMQDPRAAAMYQQHRAQGGQMSPQQFAYMYAATGGFSREGTAAFQRNEAANGRAEHNTALGLRQAEANRGQAQQGYINGGHAINQEAGNGLQGRGTYVGPNGQSYVLPTIQPGQIQRDPNTGAAFVMNNQGQYFMYTPNGWQPMRSAY